ncbi:histidinol dehydrogenase [Ulvibacter sp. MAR_2010_11]|uniref:histidinol dehydrogenase n=1 Tax=Ulvibacter sp. MAR_2010_11 TaxID=1250229 RepID=UPI000C2C5649|nr:histidinol dehydrogenase [Ulvibacter sp. MAR_2010_11]PKA84024.1 histidinol dehydrogenase [Ulvibacter sp. MAR_2010_11]
MKLFNQPPKQEWDALCRRPVHAQESMDETISEVLKNVKRYGDVALQTYSKKFDGLDVSNFSVKTTEFLQAEKAISSQLKDAINLAKRNIEKFHTAQKEAVTVVETTSGVACWRKSAAIEKVGLYIPGGTAPLFSTILMLGIPANLAGCREIVLCTPPNKAGEIDPAILYTAQLVGITKVFKVGGAQAIAAMAYGTKQIPQVYKIFGPGNQYVTKAKELVQQGGIPIDMPAGPSELLIIADRSCVPEFVASDLLSQAEHGADSQVLLLCESKQVIEKVMNEVKQQLLKLPRKAIAEKALANSMAICFNSLEECIDFSNSYAPEHLIIATENATSLAESIINAGSVFLGNYSCESAGDYASGTNHTLPTNGFARNYSGVSLESFVKKITFQKLSAEGLANIGPSIELMAEAEGLYAHKNAVTIRLKSLQNDGTK